MVPRCSWPRGQRRWSRRRKSRTQAGGTVEPGVELRRGGRIGDIRGVLRRAVLFHRAGGAGPAEQEVRRAALVRRRREVLRREMGAHG